MMRFMKGMVGMRSTGRTYPRSIHAYEARQAFARCVARGEAGVNLAETALHISSEDDALGEAHHAGANAVISLRFWESCRGGQC